MPWAQLLVEMGSCELPALASLDQDPSAFSHLSIWDHEPPGHSFTKEFLSEPATVLAFVLQCVLGKCTWPLQWVTATVLTYERALLWQR
jgi:hypothetical protein